MSYNRGIGLIMEKPILSPNFTIEDVHKLREYNYYRKKRYVSSGKGCIL